jgi:integrase
MFAAARKRRSPHIVPALALGLHAGLRDSEIRGLQCERVNLEKAVLTVGHSKTEARAGRSVPLNADLMAALVAHAKWHLKTFGETRPGWYVFPFGKPLPRPHDGEAGARRLLGAPDLFTPRARRPKDIGPPPLRNGVSQGPAGRGVRGFRVRPWARHSSGMTRSMTRRIYRCLQVIDFKW